MEGTPKAPIGVEEFPREALSRAILQGFLQMAPEHGLKVELINTPKQPWKIVERPGGGICWGVGGCGTSG